ncbi:type II secretion system minor pseudopilin GspH [Pseudomonas monteilii]|uniref:type II secretion system minor pseudopilin GspH n=1 Tax=Pseudomonas monteilii TaxID=76759 RepID=UPI00383A6450
MRQNRSRGFTLLEIMLVLLLVGVVLAMAGLQVGQGPQRLARQEAALFLQLVQYARQQAVLEGRDLAVHVDPRGYQLVKGERHSVAAQGQRRDTGLDLHLEIDGLAVMPGKPEGTAQLVFSRSDEHTPFSLSFHEAGVSLAQVSSDGLNDPWLER